MKQPKRKLKVKELATDIIGGMTDSSLMDKYDLAERQLKRLLQKMVSRGYLTQDQLDARLDLDDTNVTREYIDVQQSIQEMDDAEVSSIIAQAQPNILGGKRKINRKNFLNDVQAGVDDGELMKKYELATIQLEHMLERILDSGQVTEKDLEDRTNLTDSSITRAFIEVQRSMDAFEEDE
jgi:hypothetical protein